MLPQTRRAIATLLQVGLPRSKFRVRTSWDERKGQYEETHIVLLLPFQQLLPFVEKLSHAFTVVVFFFDGVSFHVSIEMRTPGLYKYANGTEFPMSFEELRDQGWIEQLALW